LTDALSFSPISGGSFAGASSAMKPLMAMPV
jgi:hypothetical protein